MFQENANFYPTPKSLTKILLNKLKLDKKKRYKQIRILEPSAGKGDLIEGFKECWVEQQEELFKDIGWKHRTEFKPNEEFKFDCIELDPILADILRGKGYNVVHNDFLTFEGRYYDVILMNPPFSQGAEHLLHAIRLQERVGGQIVCILNSETLRNTYSNNRKVLSQLLEKYNADIEYIQNGFSEAERKTDVEIAVIYIDVPMVDNTTMFEKEFEKENPDIKFEELRALTTKKSKIEQLVEECEIVKKSVSNLFIEKMRVDSLLHGIGLTSGVKICANGTRDDKAITINDFYSKVDLDFWNKMVDETDLISRLPSKLRNTFRNNMELRSDIPFTLNNAFYFYEELMNSIPQSYEQMVADIFDKVTVESHYSKSDWCKNIHMYNGWKTNSAYKVGKKVIIPYYNDGYMYNLPDVLTDLVIIFENLSGIRNTLSRDYKQGDSSPYMKLLEAIKNCEKNIECEFFYLDVYKKGTLHVKFKDMDLVHRFNLIASKHKQWLPPSFGEKSWSDMDEEEKSAIRNFGIGSNEYILYTGKQDYLRLMEG